MMRSEETPGPVKAGLHLVEDKKRTVATAEPLRCVFR
jgi:hypothetical protein